jgi:alpha-mannosidase
VPSDVKKSFKEVANLARLRSPTSPDPNADGGHHRFRYALYPHSGDWKRALTERRGYEYNYKLLAMQVQPHNGALPLRYSDVTVKPETVVLTAIRKEKDADGLICRVCEWAGKGGDVQVRVPPGARSATVTDLMEKPGTQLEVSHAIVTAPINPFEILTVRVEYAPRPPAAESQ